MLVISYNKSSKVKEVIPKMPELKLENFERQNFKPGDCRLKFTAFLLTVLNKQNFELESLFHSLEVLSLIPSLFITVVKELAQDCVGGAELQNCRATVQALVDEVSSSLKKHVYQNYMQFIDTSKEISSKFFTPPNR